MSKMIIRGDFTIESDLKWIKNMKQPFKAMELEIMDTCPMFIPVKCHRMTSAESVHKTSKNGGKNEA